jgi:DNA repair protein RecO (recombination protein O)
MLSKDEAVCLRAIDYSETSQIVTLFTRTTGKISAIAKGSKRQKSAFEGPIEILSWGQIVFTDADRDKLATLTEFQQQPEFARLRSNLFAMNCCLFAAELVNSLTHDHDVFPELYDSMIQFLQDVNDRQTDTPAREILGLLIVFQLSLLKEIGLKPILNCCVNCKSSFNSKWREAHFSSSANGLICGDCEGAFSEKIKLSQKTAHCLANLQAITTTDDTTLHNIEQVLVGHFTEILRRKPKMAKQILRK